MYVINAILLTLKNLYLFCAKHDVFSFISLCILAAGATAGYFRFFAPRKSIKNFLIKFDYEKAEGWNFPLRIRILFTNHTGQNVYITSASFKCENLRPAPNANVDTHTKKMPIKFPREVLRPDGSREVLLHDFEYFIRVDETVGSYAPINPEHTDEEIENAFRLGKVGTFNCYVTLLSRRDKPTVYRLKLKPKEQFPARVIALPAVREITLSEALAQTLVSPGIDISEGLHETNSSETSRTNNND